MTSTQQHEGFIHDNTRQPSRKLRLFLKLAELEERLVKSVLESGFEILAVLRYALRQGKNSPFVTKNQFLEGERLSTLCGGHQRGVGVFADISYTKGFHNSVPPGHLLKRQTTLNRAIGTPEATDDDDGLELTDRIGDGSCRCMLNRADRGANLSGCWQAIYSAGLASDATQANWGLNRESTVANLDITQSKGKDCLRPETSADKITLVQNILAPPQNP